MKVKALISAIVVAVLLYACDPCSNCGPLTFEPSAEFVFINADSSSVLVDSIRVNDSLEIVYDARSADYRDTLDDLNIGLDTTRTNLSADTVSFLTAISLYTDSLTTSSENADIVDSLATVMKSVNATINSGLVLISTVELLETGSTLTYEDSATSYFFPLSYDESFNTYRLQIAEELFELSLDYTVVEEVDEQRFVRLRAEDIMVVSYTNFDSLQACETNCTDNNARFTFYF